MNASEAMQDFFRKAIEEVRISYSNSGVDIISEDISIDEVWITTSDHIKLRAFIYKPRHLEKLPLILQRTCYPQNEAFNKVHAEELARRGYAFMWEYCRGTGGSEGSWEPNVNDRSDGLDTLAWLEEQDWVESIGYWGDSYLAFTGWIMADAVTPKVKSMCLGNYGTDRYTSAYEKGLFRHDVLTSWAMGNAGHEITADYLESCRYRPHELVDEALWGQKLSWYRQWITNTRREDAYWQEGFWKELRDIPSKMKIPVCITEGWFDHHLGSALRTWDSLSDFAKQHSWLEIGPMNHFGQNSISAYQPENLHRSKCPTMLEWFELTLKKKEYSEKTVHLYIIGEDRWKKVSDWPSPDTIRINWYLQDDNYDCQNDKKYTKCNFIYDPENPVPSRGAEAMLYSMSEIGSLKQPVPGFREDVLTFCSDALTFDMSVFGRIKVTLFVASDAPDTSFSAKLMEVTPKGEAYNIRSSITTIGSENEKYIPGTPTTVNIDMWDVAWTIGKGSRIRLDISSSDFPQYSVHSNYPGIWSQSQTTKKAKQTVYFSKDRPSRIEIEIYSRENIEESAKQERLLHLNYGLEA